MRRGLWSIVATVILIVLPGAALAQDEDAQAEAAPSSTFDKTVAFENLEILALDGKAGEVDVRSVEFTVANKKSGGFMGIGGSEADFEVVITTRLVCSTTDSTKWKLGIMIDFLDADGNVIDRVTNSDSIKNNDKKIDFKHTTLKWALSHIKEARVTVVAKQ